MKIKKEILFLLSYLIFTNSSNVQSQVAAYEQDFLKFNCNSGIKAIDLDGDGLVDCLYLERRSEKYKDQYRVWVHLSSKQIWIWLHDFGNKSETEITAISLAKYDHPGFSTARTSARFAYRIADYERSSRLYYFDKNLERVVIFWESD